MDLIEKYGRSTLDRVNYLIKSLSEEEKANYFRLESFIKIWASCHGGSFDINEHSGFFMQTSTYALRQIDAVFFKKFGVHIERHQHQLSMSDDEWENGIPPLAHTAQP